MKQNIYDNPAFFGGYRKLRDNDSGLNGAVENPAFFKVLPDLLGRRVLDLGCGFGEFCRFARAQGASFVQGIDISQKMLQEAKNRTIDPEILYLNTAIEDFKIESNSYDVVVSRMALHYVRDYAPLVRLVHRGLRDHGDFVFSVEHPVCTAVCSDWVKDGNGNRLFWPVDCYGTEGSRQQHWFVDGVLKYHRSVQSYVNTLLDAGFRLTRLLEPQADAETVQKRPELEATVRRPAILVVATRKPPKP